MFKRIIVFMLLMFMIFSLSACGNADDDAGIAQDTHADKANMKDIGNYKIGIVTPTLSTSEDEFRAGAEMVKKYPNIVKHITLPENFNAELETGISQILSLADNPDMKAIIVNSGQSGLLPAFEQIRKQRPDIITIATMLDEPELMSKYGYEFFNRLDKTWGNYSQRQRNG